MIHDAPRQHPQQVRHEGADLDLRLLQLRHHTRQPGRYRRRRPCSLQGCCLPGENLCEGSARCSCQSGELRTPFEITHKPRKGCNAALSECTNVPQSTADPARCKEAGMWGGGGTHPAETVQLSWAAPGTRRAAARRMGTATAGKSLRAGALQHQGLEHVEQERLIFIAQRWNDSVLL